ncbi:C4-dicarboxylate TRAP transporter substrate-binding protein [Pusillimonas sp.]|uniref:C4-dicarboxylate TRAP transporter substrate-binding protein n=1 Tax=Pusillimonas sp. TaxID=3040095 RepID=UPI0029AB9202|nr:C4-dicarboxylate TRAP transporter substrate-binding protein [Pusillimonas sp.]MDX3895563.1 C4-dicarboxylate TRAP transporter substrate-binding protein [Pusillimonas sp.]
MKLTYVLKLAATAAAMCLPMLGATQTLRYNTFMPPLAIETKGIQEFFAELKTATDGRVKGQVFVGGQMLGGQATLSGIRDGVVDGGFIIPTLNASEIPHVAMLPELLPFAADFWAATGATNETIMLNCDECKQDLANYKAVWLGGIGASPWHMMCRQPINGVDDLKGKKVRVTGGFAMRMISGLGATAVALPASEIPAAMQQGVIDCAVGTLSWLNTLGLINMVKGVIDEPFGSYHGIGQFVFNQASLAKLSPEDRKTFMSLIPKHLAKLNEAYAADERKAREVAVKKGISFWKPDAQFDEIMDAFRQKEPGAVARDIVSQGGSADAERIVREHIDTLEKWQKLAADVEGDPEAFASLLDREIYSKPQD